MGQETFKEVIVSQAIRPITDDGRMGVDPEDVMPPTFHLERIAEKLLRRAARPPEPRGLDRRGAPAPARSRPITSPIAPSPLRTISRLQSFSEPAGSRP